MVAAVSPHKAHILSRVPCEQVVLGDLEDLENQARAGRAQVLISNSHADETARRLGLPLIRAGWPIYDRLGAQHQLWIGYQGGRDTLITLANQLLAVSHRHEIPARVSIYSKPEPTCEVPHAALETG